MAIMSSVKVRNVGIFGHGGAGKTMLIEHILHDAGKTNRLGTIQERNTVCDYLDEEKERQQTLCLKVSHVDWEGHRIHIVDHPGYADFLGETASSMPMLDSAIIVVDAVTGIQIGTDNAVKYAAKYDIPHAFFVNKLDRDGADFYAVVEKLRAAYGKTCVPLVVPIGKGEGLKGVVNILTGDHPDVADRINELKTEMADAVAESDDKLLERYLETGELSEEDFDEGLHVGIQSGKIVPIIAGCVDKDYGIPEMLHLIAVSFPTPMEHKVIALKDNGSEVELEVTPDAPFVGQVFRSVTDPFVGQLTIFRVVTGTLRSESEFYNVTTRTKERTGKVFLLCGKEQVPVDEVGPGDIAAMTKLKNTHFGNTIAAPGVDVQMPPIELPESLVKLAIVPKSRADEDKIGEVLHKLAEDDPTFSHYRDPDTNEHIIKGLGDLQLEILVERMRRKFHVEADTHPPKVALKETIRGKSEAQGRYKKQTGGHGQFGDCHLRVSPNERGAGYKFVDSIVGGVVPRQFIPAVDKGVQECLAKGIIAGYPVVDIVVELYYGSYHDVDSSEMAFKVAASMGLQKAFKDARPCLLEPVLIIEITVPEEYMGDITGDLNSRRGRILGMDSAGPGKQLIRAYVPEAEVLRYSADLRSITGGRGTYTLKFDHYDEVPENIAQPIIAKYEADRSAEH
ncbi:MAG: elongation factor G [Candidatus Hydrogenedentota bacterium]